MAKIKYLLFDLDGTLLHFNLDHFIDQYLNLVKNHFTDVQEPQRIPAWILKGSDLMLKNQGKRLNAEIFLEYFSAQVKLSRDVIKQRFMHFYQNDFGTLIELTRSVPEARTMLKAAVAAGYKLILATQPVFPLVAIRQRLHWADLDDIPFELITHSENMHACKPSPLYFKEIMKLLQIRPEQCLMIGNELATDMASKKVGIKSFFLSPLQSDIHHREVDFSGNLTDLAGLLGLKMT